MSGLALGLAALAAIVLALAGALMWVAGKGRQAQQRDDLLATNRQQKEMLDAAADRPVNRSALARRLRGGDF